MRASDRKAARKASTVDWYALGKVADKTRRTGGWGPEYATFDEWLRAFAQEFGHTAHSLRRFAALVEFIERLSAEGRMTKEQAAAARRAPVASLEVLKQANRRMPGAVNHWLPDVLSGKKTYREVRALIKGLRKYSGTVNARSFPEWCARLIPEHASLFCASSNKVEGRIPSPRGLRFVAPGLVLVTREPGERNAASLVGFEFRFKVRFLTVSELDSLAGELAFQSTFFTSFWLVLPARTGKGQELDKILTRLGCSNVGIAEAEYPPPPGKVSSREPPFRMLRRPRGQPLLDRRRILIEELISNRLLRSD